LDHFTAFIDYITMSNYFTSKQRRILIIILILTALTRLFTLGSYPLADTTEARYAEIARKMFEIGNWVTPMEDYNVPFWAKPPLSTWLTAMCFMLFGVSEFTARLSSFLLALIFCWLTYEMALRQRGRDFALLSVFILATAGLTFVTAGAVMTDGAVVLSTTLCMVAFWRAVREKGRLWGYLFFVGLALGLLSKGLVPVVLTLLPIGLWVVWKNQWATVWTRIPWLSGSVLALALAVPWYAWAEARTPGFLNYFFIGEHFGKFTDSGWKGDLYGTAHGHPRGTIWLYWLESALPWSLVFTAIWLRRILRPRPTETVLPIDEWTAYLVSWTFAPMLFFTLAGNVMHTYVMPGLPAFAMLLIEFWLAKTHQGEAIAQSISGRGFSYPLIGMVTPVLVLGLVFTIGPELVSRKSQKAVVSHYDTLRPNAESKLVYVYPRPHSAEFYSRGKAIKSSPDQVEQYFLNGTQDFFVLRSVDFALMPAAALARLEPVWTYREYSLMRERERQP
jgi:4-amino-4-deoxy-L-arabinose transferase-like glycosyltransferase